MKNLKKVNWWFDMPAKPKVTLKNNILDYLEKTKRAVPFSVLYQNFPAHTKNGIRVSIYRLVKEGLVEKASQVRPVTYKAKKFSS
jgi:hypothetical protein